MIHLHAAGRGRKYTFWRGLSESVLRVAYAGSWPARLWAKVPGATDVRVVRHEVRLAPDRGLARPLRVAFASDLHIGPTTPDALLDRAFERLAESRPDVLALGGDYVMMDATPERAARLAELAMRVPAAVKVAVLGNHDLWADHALLEKELDRAGVRVLVNASLRLSAPHARVVIVGLDDPWTGSPDPERAFEGVSGSDVAIVLSHGPDGFSLVAKSGRAPALLLAGHTHGGHIALPGPRPIILPGGPDARRWPFGIHRAGATTVVVSRGLGGAELPMRAFAPPDVVVVDLA